MSSEPSSSGEEGQAARGNYIAQARDNSIAVVSVLEYRPPPPLDPVQLSAADHRFSELPTRVVPPVGMLPAGSRMPLAVNPLFVGRQADLLALANRFRLSDPGNMPIVAITGMGGIGKTQLAVEFVHRYGSYFAGVFWLNFADPALVPTEVAACGRGSALGLRPDFASLTFEEQLALVVGAWQSPLPRLLVFDNCEDPEFLDAWRPKTGGCRVLLTSQRFEWDAALGVQIQALRELPSAESIKLLRKWRQDLRTDDASLSAIAHELGGLPLALHLAGLFLGHYRDVITPEGYLAKLSSNAALNDVSLEMGDLSPTRHVQNVAKTFALSYERLDPHDSVDAQARLLLACSTLLTAGDPIPQDLLVSTLNLQADQTERLLQAHDAVRRLLDVGLLEQATPRTVRLHPLVAAFVRQLGAELNVQVSVEQALSRRYQKIRDTMSSGAERTYAMSDLVPYIQTFARRATYEASQLRQLFMTGAEGNRLVALIVITNTLQVACFDLVLECVENSHSAFEQFHALVGARDMLSALSEGQKNQLLDTLQTRKGRIKDIGPDTSRRVIIDSILRTMNASTTLKVNPHQSPGGNTPDRYGPDDFVTDTTENATITHHSLVIGGKTIAYTATAGHLVTADPYSSKPGAKIFYVAFFAEDSKNVDRPVTFFYNRGPGSSSVYALLGSFAPQRIRTSMPSFTPPAPYSIEPNPDSLLDESDLVFISPVGTGYSAAIAPFRNRDFWGVDQEARSLSQFIKRFLTRYDRWNSPKFLLGESYGTARTCVLAYMLHADGVSLNGVTLLSSILDYREAGNPVGLLPTLCADAWFHKRIIVNPPPADLTTFMNTVVPFAQTQYAALLSAFPNVDPQTVQTLSAYTGIASIVLTSWEGLNVSESNNLRTLHFLTTLLQTEGKVLSAYDGRVTGVDTGIAAVINPLTGGNDATMTAINSVYTAMWQTYLHNELEYSATSAFIDLNDQAFANWDFGHVDPTGAQKGKDPNGNVVLSTAGDLAAMMSVNADFKVLSANGYFDSVTPFLQTTIDLQKMPLANPALHNNVKVKCYPSGHMLYLDPGTRAALKSDLAAFYRDAS